MASFTLTHPDLTGTKKVRCKSVTISGNVNTEAKPDVNQDGTPTEVQTNSYENLKIVVNGLHFPDGSDDLTWDDIKTLYTTKYDGTNYITLNIGYGPNTSETAVSGLTGTDIKCVLKTPSVTIDVGDSRYANLPTGSLTFIETN